MTSSAGIKNYNNQNAKNHESQRPTKSLCQHLCYLLPCFKRRTSPTSSRSSSKTSKHNFFLENHYIIKCPKKKCQNKDEAKKESEEDVKNVVEGHMEKTGNHKEVRFLGAAKKSCEKEYLRILGMEPTEYLNQFSSVFIKNLKTPIPKDPCALPKKFNVYIPPKKKSNRSLTSLTRVTDVRNFLQYTDGGHNFSVNRSISSLVKEKCSSFQKRGESFGDSENLGENAKQVFYDDVTPQTLGSADCMDPFASSDRPETLWQTRDRFPCPKYSDRLKDTRRSQSKSKRPGYFFEGSSKNDKGLLNEGSKSTHNIETLNSYLPSDMKKGQGLTEPDESCFSKTTSGGKLRSEEESGGEEEEESTGRDDHPWPNHDFLQLRAGISSTAFRQAALRNYHKYSKTLVWKLIIKNQKEYIKFSFIFIKFINILLIVI